jgi:hypothetical protein
MAHDGHGSKRIIERPAAIAAHLVASASNGEDTAYVAMVTTENKIKRLG